MPPKMAAVPKQVNYGGAYNTPQFPDSGSANTLLSPYGMHQPDPSQINPYLFFNNQGYMGDHPRVAGMLDNALSALAFTHGGQTIGDSISGIAQGMLGSRQAHQQNIMNQVMGPFNYAAQMAPVRAAQDAHDLAIQQQNDANADQDLKRAHAQYFRDYGDVRRDVAEAGANGRIDVANINAKSRAAVPRSLAGPTISMVNPVTGMPEIMANPNYNPNTHTSDTFKEAGASLRTRGITNPTDDQIANEANVISNHRAGIAAGIRSADIKGSIPLTNQIGEQHKEVDSHFNELEKSNLDPTAAAGYAQQRLAGHTIVNQHAQRMANGKVPEGYTYNGFQNNTYTDPNGTVIPATELDRLAKTGNVPRPTTTAKPQIAPSRAVSPKGPKPNPGGITIGPDGSVHLPPPSRATP